MTFRLYFDEDTMRHSLVRALRREVLTCSLRLTLT